MGTLKIVIIIIIVLLCLCLYCYLENYRLTITDYTVTDPSLPDEFSNKKLLLLSDLHCTRHGRNNSRLLDMVKDSDCDCIVIAGDLINGKSDSEFPYAEEILSGLKKLQIPIYYCYGNHEQRLIWYDDAYPASYKELSEQYTSLINNRSVSFLDSTDAVIYGHMLPLEFDRGDAKKLSKLLDVSSCFSDSSESKYKILLAHDPVFIDNYLATDANLIMSGHVHGGIIRLPLLGGLLSPRRTFFPKPDKGIYKVGKTWHIISGGVGWHTIPFRFNNLPELVRITLKQG